MTLKEYIKNMLRFAKANPEALNMFVISSVDDEGNKFVPVEFYPSKGVFEDNMFSSYYFGMDESQNNAVCIN